MSDQTLAFILVVVAGFFLGGAWTTRHSARPVAVVAGVLGALALAGAVLRMV
ncbi:hypothetical protein [Rhodococcus sp. X156]|uniref:hypothetical protein n=1 Tax=Rhodococcus sp. X156 TaxID=2499145 RepID=UPI0013E28B1A|nr:hypothetical protein [Rhodococcus sp. X156]